MINDSIWANDDWSDTVTADKAETSWVDDMVNGMNEAVSFDDAFDAEVIKTREEVRAELDAKARREFTRKGGSTTGLFSAAFANKVYAWAGASHEDCFDAYVAGTEGAWTELAGIIYSKAYKNACAYFAKTAAYSCPSYIEEKARDIASMTTLKLIEVAKASGVANARAVVKYVTETAINYCKDGFKKADNGKKARSMFNATYGITDNGEDIWVSSAVTGIEAMDHYDPYFDLYVAIGELDANARDAVIACYFNGMNVRSWGSETGRSKSAIGRDLARAYKDLEVFAS